MRGTVIMWNGEQGVVASGGQKFDFTIQLWGGNVAPRADMAVQLVCTDGELNQITPVAEADLAKERLGQVSQGGIKMANVVLADVGKPVVLAYAVFAVAAWWLQMVSGQVFGASLGFSLPMVLSGGLESGGATLSLLLALATVAIPAFWKHKYAPLALCAPLLLTLYADYKLYRMYAETTQQVGQLFGGGFAAAVREASPFSLGAGAYLSLAASGFIAFSGIKRYLARPH